MIFRFSKWLFAIFVLFSVAACDMYPVDNEPPELPADIEINVIEQDVLLTDLTNTEYFRPGALEHILEGEINRKGDAVGFHYEGLTTAKGIVVEETRTKPNKYGVYEAEVEVEGIKKQGNRGISSFFPSEWSAQKVIDAINEAYHTKQYIAGNTYEGLSEDGVVIHMYLDQDDKIISAFPLY